MHFFIQFRGHIGEPPTMSWSLMSAKSSTFAPKFKTRYLIEQDFNYWFDLDDIDILEQHNEDFRAQENEEQLLAVYFDIPAEGKGQFMTTAEISDKLVTMGSIKRPMSLSRLGMLLKKAGYRQKCLGGKVRGWIVYEREAGDVRANRTIQAQS